LNLGAVEIEFFTPHEPGFDTSFHNAFEELLKGRQAIPIADLAQTTVIRYRFRQVVADVPTMGQVHIDRLHQLAFRANPLEEGNQL